MKIQEMIEALKQPIEPQWINSKKLKGNRIDYVAWFNICELLDTRIGCGSWAWQIVSVIILPNKKATTAENGQVVMIDDSKVSVMGKLTIYADDCSREFSATGIEDMNCSSYGDPTSNASAMALRRAAAIAGLARELWRKDGKKPSSQPGRIKNVVSVNSGNWEIVARKTYLAKGIEANIVNKYLNTCRSKEEFVAKCEAVLAQANS